jgi:hypothetical protein
VASGDIAEFKHDSLLGHEIKLITARREALSQLPDWGGQALLPRQPTGQTQGA